METRSASSKALGKLVDRSRKDPFFLGWALAQYQAAHGLDDQQLTEWLECSSTALDRLALCRLPDDGKRQFREEVQRIAEFARCDADRLVSLLREVAAFSTLRGVAGDVALLIAARDRKPSNEAPEDEA